MNADPDLDADPDPVRIRIQILVKFEPSFLKVNKTKCFFI
jgi:hypothetical protein